MPPRERDHADWLRRLDEPDSEVQVDGLIRVAGYSPEGRPPNEVATMEKAAYYGAHAVFFRAQGGRPSTPEAFIYVTNGPENDQVFGDLHRRLWSWGGVPLVYRRTKGIVQLFRCAHGADFIQDGQVACKPAKTLKLLADVAEAEASDPWWDATRIRNGTLWDDPKAREVLLYEGESAHHNLISAIKQVWDDLSVANVLPKGLRRRLLVLSILIAYLEARQIFDASFFGRFLGKDSARFFEVLAHGESLLDLLDALKAKFNGNVFCLKNQDRDSLRTSSGLDAFARLVEARDDAGDQLALWNLYSFRDVPVEVISHIYQLFVKDADSSVYTPPFLVRLMLEETLSLERLDRLEERGEVILDPCCGSGVFLVEAYKQLILHWRARNGWAHPTPDDLQRLLGQIWGVDMEEGAIELAAFSLCLALSDALDSDTIRARDKLFPELIDKTLHRSCFFSARQDGVFSSPIGVVVGNPPFESKLRTSGARESCQRYEEDHGRLPDKQVAYLFLRESADALAPDGVICLLQSYNVLYNENSRTFRRAFFKDFDVREILDLVSVRGLFAKGKADTKVVAIVAEKRAPPPDRLILHATFRRTGRVDAEQGFDIDYYDLHWLPRAWVLENDGVWRSNLLGGGRVLGFADRLRNFRSLREYAVAQGWDHGEGFIAGESGRLHPAEHVTGHPVLPSRALTKDGVNVKAITTVEARRFKSSYTAARFTPPMVLVREHMDLPHTLWAKDYLTYGDQVVGFCAPEKAPKNHEEQGLRERRAPVELKRMSRWLTSEKRTIAAYVAATSTKLFTKKATAVSAHDILSIPYPEEQTFDLGPAERIIVDDIVDYYRDLIRLGEKSDAMKPIDVSTGSSELDSFVDVYVGRIGAIYKSVRALPPYTWPGIICQPFVFGEGRVSWEGADELREKLDACLRRQNSPSLSVTRIARIYDGAFMFLLKPNRVRYWLRSTALRDADETLADLRQQGF